MPEGPAMVWSDEGIQWRRYRKAWRGLMERRRVERDGQIRPEVKAKIREIIDRVDHAEAVKDQALAMLEWRTPRRGRRRKP